MVGKPARIAALTTWPRPNNIKELKCFFGFAGYYRRFRKVYSKIAKPLNDLTAGYLPPNTLRISLNFSLLNGLFWRSSSTTYMG